MTSSIQNLGERVRKLRKERWRSQEKFVKYIQQEFDEAIHQTTLSGIERGEKYPSLDNLALLAVALDTNSDYLLGMTTDDRPVSQLDDQVIVTVEDPQERKELQEALDMLTRATKEDKQYILGLVRRLAPKKPRIIGGE